MKMAIVYHSKYESEAKELETFLEDGSWDENHEVISVNDDDSISFDVEMEESEDDVYDIVCEGTTVCSNPSSGDEVVEAILDQKDEWGVKPYEYDDDGEPIDKPE
jgi:hypothetical protein